MIEHEVSVRLNDGTWTVSILVEFQNGQNLRFSGTGPTVAVALEEARELAAERESWIRARLAEK